MTPCEKLGYKVGDRFEVISDEGNPDPIFNVGNVIELARDDATKSPVFKLVHGDVTDYMARKGYSDHYYSLEDIRPLKPEWDGTGLPPAGAVVECLCPESKVWVKCDIIGPYGDYVVGAPNGGGFYGFDANELRPIRSGRDKAIEEIKSIIVRHRWLGGDGTASTEIATALYDAGYRKQQETKA